MGNVSPRFPDECVDREWQRVGSPWDRFGHFFSEGGRGLLTPMGRCRALHKSKAQEGQGQSLALVKGPGQTLQSQMQQHQSQNRSLHQAGYDHKSGDPGGPEEATRHFLGEHRKDKQEGQTGQGQTASPGRTNRPRPTGLASRTAINGCYTLLDK